jgi:hypothetical protein
MTRPKGVVLYVSPKNPIAIAAEKHQRQLRLEKQERAVERKARPVPNYICYPEAFKDRVDERGNWKGPGRLPRCRVCENILDPKDNHVCPGFTPKYVEHDEEFEERWESRHEEMRSMRFERETPTCDWCGIELPELEDYEAHMTDGCPEMP